MLDRSYINTNDWWQLVLLKIDQGKKEVTINGRDGRLGYLK